MSLCHEHMHPKVVCKLIRNKFPFGHSVWSEILPAPNTIMSVSVSVCVYLYIQAVGPKRFHDNEIIISSAKSLPNDCAINKCAWIWTIPTVFFFSIYLFLFLSLRANNSEKECTEHKSNAKLWAASNDIDTFTYHALVCLPAYWAIGMDKLVSFVSCAFTAGQSSGVSYPQNLFFFFIYCLPRAANRAHAAAHSQFSTSIHFSIKR